MIRLMGAALVIAAAGSAGLSCTCQLRRDLRAVRDMNRAVELIRWEISLRHISLPEICERLAREYPAYFSAWGKLSCRLSEESFEELWRCLTESARLPLPARDALLRLGKDLCRGIPPESAAGACAASLEQTELGLSERLKTSGRLYSLCGFAAGALLVITVI